MQQVFAHIHRSLTGAISLAVLAQMFLAGLWHAAVVSSPQAHVFLGLGLLFASLLALIAAVSGKMGSRTIGLTALLFFLLLLQPILIEQRRAGLPILSAFHTLNAAFIGMLGGIVARMSKIPQAEGKSTPSVAAAD